MCKVKIVGVRMLNSVKVVEIIPCSHTVNLLCETAFYWDTH